MNEYFIELLNTFYNIVNNKYKEKYQVEPFLKQSQYSQWMRFKVDDDCLFFDQNKQNIEMIFLQKFLDYL